MNKIHEVQSVIAQEDVLELIVDEHSYQIIWEDCSPLLASATNTQREHLDVSPSGYGIHWPDLDEDLAITPLIQRAKKSVPLEKA